MWKRITLGAIILATLGCSVQEKEISEVPTSKPKSEYICDSIQQYTASVKLIKNPMFGSDLILTCKDKTYTVKGYVGPKLENKVILCVENIYKDINSNGSADKDEPKAYEKIKVKGLDNICFIKEQNKEYAELRL